MNSLQPGTTLKHYEIVRGLGAGSMGTVFLARDVRLGRLVAIKLLQKHAGPAIERFLSEARLTALCRHENIVVIYDVDNNDGRPYLVLEYVEGRTLRDVIANERHSGMAASVAIELILPVARALACAHEMGIVHRDLKPENILVSNTGQVKVVDFGIAKQVSFELAKPTSSNIAEPATNSPLTQDGVIVGTTAYMSPEQWHEAPIDGRTDIWALGLILFELIKGSHPLAPLTYKELLEVARLDVPMPSAREQLPFASAVAAIIDACLEKRKEKRMDSAQTLVEALERMCAEKRSASALSEDQSPFAGLSAFQESEAARFFGRNEDITAAVARIHQQQLFVIAGASGSGKSSFVRAGIVPALKRAGRAVEVFIVRPGRHPLVSLADVLAFLVDTTRDAEESDAAAMAKTLHEQPGYLGAKLRARCRKSGNEHRILLFIDQFEELYTQGADAEERAAFYACIEGVADDASSPLRVVMTIRSDFLDRVAEDRRFLSAMTRGLVFLPPMTSEGLRGALEKPLEAVHYQFEDAQLVNDMLDGLSGTKNPLPLLQFTAAKLWEMRDREKHQLTRQAYEALGGVAGALSTHADTVLSGMSESERRLARSIFSRLVTPEKTRAVVPWDELCAISNDPSAVEHVVQHLGEARLISIEMHGEREKKVVELVHESLVTKWAKLRKWLEENENDAQFLAELRNAAAQWEKSGHADGFLWRDQAADDAGRWFAQHREHALEDRTLELGSREIDYLEAVVGLANRAKRKQKQVLGVVMASLCGVFFVVSLLALQARSEAQRADAKANEAQKNAELAKQNAAEARNATRMATANAHKSDATLGLVLLREVEPTAALPRKWKELAQFTLRQEIARVVLMHDEPLHWASFSPDGQRIVTASWDRKARVWNADGSGVPVVLEGHTAGVQSAAFSPDGLRIVTTSSDKTVRIWNADGSGKSILLQEQQGPANSAAFSPDGKRIVAASTDKTVKVWNADGSGKPIVLEGHQGPVNCAAFSLDGKRIGSASDDGTARLWNVDGQGEPTVLRGHRDRVFSVAFSPDGQRIVTTSFDNTARVWNADGSGTPIVLAGHDNAVCGAAFSPDGKTIVTASWDRTARVWNADGQGSPFMIEGHQDKLCTASFRPDGKQILTASLDKSVRLWDANRRDKPQRLEGHEGTILSAAFGPDGRHIVTAAIDSTARVWDLEGTAAPLLLRGHEGKVGSASFSPDGQRIVTAGQDKTARVWDAKGGETLHVLRGHDDAVWSAAFSPDGQRIVTASWDKTVRVWNADGIGEPLVLRGHENTINSAAFSPDGKRIISASEDHTTRLWNADGSGEPRVLRGHTAGVYSATFSPDGQHIITASWDKLIRIYDSNSNDPLLVFEHGAAVGTGSVGGMGAFSPDGNRFVTIADDKTLHIWNTNGAGEPMVIHFPELNPTVAAFSPDGSRIVTASHERKDPATGITRYWATIWPAFEPNTSPDDIQLWRATRYCPPLRLRVALLGVSKREAQGQLEACRAHVAQAFEGAAD